MIGQQLRARMSVWGDDTVVTFNGRSHPGRALSDLAAMVVRLVGEAAPHPDEAIAFVVRNRPAHLAALFALLAENQPIRFVNGFQAPEKIVRDLDALGARIALADADDWGSAALQAWATMPSHDAIALRTDDAARISPVPQVANAPGPLMPGIALEMFTSGTTGTPKRVAFTADTLSAAIKDQALIAAEMGELPASPLPEAALVQYAPILHIAGLWTALQMGVEGRQLVMFEKFDAASWIEAIQTFKPRMAGMSPPLLRMVLALNPPRSALESLVAIRSGSAALDDDTRQAFHERYGIPLLGVYGATEYAGVVASWSLAQWKTHGATRSGCVGRMRDHVAQARILHDDGSIAETGKIGILELRVERVGPDWLRTTDLASLDEAGFLTLHGRADSAIVRGGFKIIPEQLDALLRRHPAIADVAVVGLPDPLLGQVPVAAVELKPRAEATEAELRAYMRSELPAYQVPASILVVAALPRTPAAKIIKDEVVNLFPPRHAIQ